MHATSTNFYVLLEDPLVVVISSGLGLAPGIELAVRHAAGRRCHILVQPSWHLPSQIEELVEAVRVHPTANPRLHFTFLCPTPGDTDFLRTHGLDGLHVHTNAFIDHRIFRPVPQTKRLPAIHVASVEPFKRHRLAWGVEDIGVITYDWRKQQHYAELVGYRRLGYANFSIVDEHCILGGRLKPAEVASIVAAARCGLILSAKEGQNNASTEYLLCGIPVVSTPSVGGRDAMFDPAHTRIVEPDPRAVEAAVAEYQADAPDPLEIREAVMRKIRGHRRRFISWLSGIAGRDLLADADEDYWIPQFTNKLKRWVPV